MLQTLYQETLKIDGTMAEKGTFPALREFAAHIELGYREWQGAPNKNVAGHAVSEWIKEALPSIFAPGGRQQVDGWNTTVSADWFVNHFEIEADVEPELLYSSSDEDDLVVSTMRHEFDGVFSLEYKF